MCSLGDLLDRKSTDLQLLLVARDPVPPAHALTGSVNNHVTGKVHGVGRVDLECLRNNTARVDDGGRSWESCEKGLKCLTFVDYATGYDLHKSEDRAIVTTGIVRFRKLCLIMGLDCNEWCILQDSVNYVQCCGRRRCSWSRLLSSIATTMAVLPDYGSSARSQPGREFSLCTSPFLCSSVATSAAESPTAGGTPNRRCRGNFNQVGTGAFSNLNLNVSS